MSEDATTALLKDAFEALPEAVAVFDEEGRFVLWNSAFEAVCSEGAGLRAGTHFSDHLRACLARGLVEAAVGREEAWLAERMARFAAAEGAHEHRLSDGRWMRVQDRRLANGGRIGIRADVTRLVGCEHSARTLLDANPTPVIVSDVETLEVLWVNEAAVAFYGHPRDTFLTLKVTDYRVETAPGEVRALSRRADDPDFGSEPRLHRTSSGEHRVVKVSARTLAFEGRAAMLAAISDMTELHRTQEELRRTRNFLKQVIDHVPTAVFAKDMADGGRFVIYNRASEALFGRAAEDVIGRSDRQVFDAGEAARSAAQDSTALRLGSIEAVEDEVVRRPDGGTRSVRTRKVALAEGAGIAPRFVVGVCEDVTERRANEARIAHMAHHDGLTDLPNRYLFGDRLASALARVQDARELLAVLCIDLDGFKAVNDTWGHAAGDRLLQAVSGRLRGTLRSCDTAARFGGDEFAVLQAPIAEAHEAVGLAERMLATLSAPYAVGGQAVRVSASIGLCLAPTHGVDPSELLACADEALYRAKREGRNTFRLTMPDRDADRFGIGGPRTSVTIVADLPPRPRPEAALDARSL